MKLLRGAVYEINNNRLKEKSQKQKKPQTEMTAAHCIVL